MPVRKSKGRRRGIPHGVQRKLCIRAFSQRQLGGNQDDGPDEVNLSTDQPGNFNDDLRAVTSVWAEKAFVAIVNICSKLCLVPMVRGYNRRYETAPFWHKTISCTILTLLVLNCIHKFLTTILAVMGIIPVGTAAAVASYIGYQVQMTGVCGGLGFVILPSLTCEVINSWNPTISQVTSRLGGHSPKNPLTPWANLSCSLQVLATSSGLVLLFLIMSTFPLLFPTLPITWFNSLKIGGLMEDMDDADGDHWGTFLIHIVCTLIDMVISAVTLGKIGFAIQFIISEMGLLKLFVNSLR